MWKTSALISVMAIIGAILDTYMGHDIKYSCGVSLFFSGITIVVRQIEISFNKLKKNKEAGK